MLWSIAWVVLLAAGIGLWRLDIPFWRIGAAVMVGTYALLWIGYAPGRIARGIRGGLAREIPLPARGDPPDLYYRPSPPQLKWNWAALILGPLWYLIQGLWVHAVILVSLVFLSAGLLAPLVWLYAALKADEDLLEFRIARRNVY